MNEKRLVEIRERFPEDSSIAESTDFCGVLVVRIASVWSPPPEDETGLWAKRASWPGWMRVPDLYPYEGAPEDENEFWQRCERLAFCLSARSHKEQMHFLNTLIAAGFERIADATKLAIQEGRDKGFKGFIG